METEAAPPRSHEDLRAYRLAMDLVVGVQTLVSGLPKEERHALASQMRRASRSVPANIAEGFAKRQ